MQTPGIFTSFLVYIAILYSTDATITWNTPADGDGKANVTENSPIDAAVETINATSNETLGNFTLLTTGRPFVLAVDGSLTVSSATLDYETTPNYTLLIQAVDNSTTSTATLTVSIIDANDAPTFSSNNFSVCAVHASAAGTPVYTLSASDEDSDQLTYNITSGNTDTDFAITSGGIISTANVLNRSATESYSLEVTATDAALKATATLSITVADTCSSATSFVISLLTIFTALVYALI